MVKGLYTAYTGMLEETRRMDVMTNNLANANTTGYKREGTVSESFADQLAIKIKDTSDPAGARAIGSISQGVKIGETFRDYSQGNFEVTDGTYDLALDGNGFFGVAFTDKSGNTSVKYTRDGAFTVNKDGYLVTQDGDFVLNATGIKNGSTGQASYVKVDPNTAVTVDDAGRVFQDNKQVAQVGVTDFADYNYLEKYGENLYNAVAGATTKASTAIVNQGSLETSNVNVVTEMVNMITITRAYESNQKVIQTIDGTLDKAVNSVGKV